MNTEPITDSVVERNLLAESPVCIHPAALVQMLQFWIPRTSEFEEAIVGSIRFPFLFYEFDPESERTTIRILEALSRFERVGDLPSATVARLFVDQALRQKIATERDINKRVDLIRDELIAQHAKAAQELEQARKELESARRTSDETTHITKSLREELTAGQSEIKTIQAQLQKEHEYRASLEKQMAVLEDERQLHRFLIRTVAAGAIATALPSVPG